MSKKNKIGNCYAMTEALYYILGGKDSDWIVMRISDKDLGKLSDKKQHSCHWYLKHKSSGVILDSTVLQFAGKKPDYSKGKHSAFYPVKSGISKRALDMVDKITWREL